jgi:hypothetical protein
MRASHEKKVTKPTPGVQKSPGVVFCNFAETGK